MGKAILCIGKPLEKRRVSKLSLPNRTDGLLSTERARSATTERKKSIASLLIYGSLAWKGGYVVVGAKKQ